MSEAIGAISSATSDPISLMALWTEYANALAQSRAARVSPGSSSVAAWSKAATSSPQQLAGSQQPGSNQQAMNATTTLQAYETDLETQLEIARLASAEMLVRASSAAQRAAAGAYVQGAPAYSYEIGPDGRLYVAAASVGFDTSPVPGDPEATIRKMQQVRSAALSQANPSASDLAAAADAQQIEMQARLELIMAAADEYEANSAASERESVGTVMDARA